MSGSSSQDVNFRLLFESVRDYGIIVLDPSGQSSVPTPVRS